jgi:hypothetical protein
MCIIKAFFATDSENEDRVFENHRIRHFTKMVEDSSHELRLNRMKEWLDSGELIEQFLQFLISLSIIKITKLGCHYQFIYHSDIH